jgi:hypothetical protein
MAGVTATAIALFALAIFVGARRASESPPAASPPPVAALPSPPVVAAAEPHGEPAPLPAKHPPRRLEAVNRQELTKTLPRGAPVDVTANAGDPEAFQLAQQIRSFLRDNGYQPGFVTHSISTPPAKGVGIEQLAGGHWRVIVGSADE